ncbi:MAG TPA: PSD1 and planctomycete cytochrome C domain-containing protein [Gemmataceae bacterium]|nr:PSD1 and planctomycete cytochrome C domain-containing protein [Gemmataceae bacterium]
MTFRLLVATALLCAGPALAGSPADEFERKIRPVLIEHCYKCHSAEHKTEKGGLRLDSRDAMLKGGESGPAVVPGKPAESRLLKAIRHVEDAPKMPPKGPKLPVTVVSDFEAWIAAGAPVPAATKAAGTIDWAAARRHWAFQPVPPQESGVRGQESGVNPIDAVLSEKLNAAGLTMSRPADRRTLVRRVYFDLVGIPPTWEETEAFVNDRSSDAFDRVVDRLLSSPRYGERWGRHWLDVARFADTKDGVLMYGDDRVRPYAYTYRDYVIRAINEDLPFDRFVHEQLAADQLRGAEPWRLAAMGFLTLGRMFDNNLPDIMDDRIDTVSRALLGLTVSCARCHDHKYDPVPMADYYSLYGVFASSEAPHVLPAIEPGRKGPEEFEKKYAAKEREIQEVLDKQYALLSETARGRVADYLVHVATTPPDPLETATYFLSLAPDDLRPPIVARWRHFLAQRAKPDDPVFGPWHDLFALPEDRLAAEARLVVSRWEARPPAQVNPLVLEALAKAPLASKADVARAYGALFKRVYEESKPAKGTHSDPVREPLLAIVAGPDSPAYFPKSHTWRYMSRGDKDGFGGKLTELDRLAVKEPNAPPRAMVVVDSQQLYDPKVFVRGNPARPGDAIPRRFLAVLSGDDRKPFPHGSGRLDLAKAITDPANPLTARVIANRVWQWHFGEPLVETPNDFGFRCPPPTQLALLDQLAATLVADGWSLKKLHRRILLSQAYRQSSLDRPEARKIDSDNKLLWRMNRQRLDLEAMRDGMLAAAGRLDGKMFGRPVDVVNDPGNRRRTIYGLVDRQSLPNMFRAFDFASPDQSAERRPLTTVPQQALFAMNAPFVHEQAKAVAARTTDRDPANRVAHLYRTVLLRDPDPTETKAGLAFVEAAAATKEKSALGPWEQYAQVLLLTNEFMFVD